MATPTQKANQEFTEAMLHIFTKADRWGNFKFTNTLDDTYRIKLNKNSWRFEKKISSGWIKVFGKFYTQTNERHIHIIINKYTA